MGKLSPPPLDSRSGPPLRDIYTNNFCLKSNLNQYLTRDIVKTKTQKAQYPKKDLKLKLL